MPAQRFPTIETDGRELAKELGQARAIAKQNIEKKQREQKKYYDQNAKDVKLNVGDLVMLKTEPRFRLDRSYKGPFEIKSLTSTNAMIQLKDDVSAEELNVSRQRLSLCKPDMLHSTPWTGHSGKLRKRRRIRRKANQDSQTSSHVQSNDLGVTADINGTNNQRDNIKFSRSGRPIRKPVRFRTPEGDSKKKGEIVGSRETRDHVHTD